MLKLSLLVFCFWSTNAHSISNSVVDISNWQKNVNLAEVKKGGITAVIHKVTEGTSYIDPYFKRRRTQAGKVGLLWGAYHFGTGGNPLGQADHFLKEVGNTKDVLLVLDLEENPNGQTMSAEEAEQFVSRIRERTGRYPVIYGSSYFLQGYDRSNLNRCGLWVAHWTAGSQPNLPPHRKTWKLWQYTDGKAGGTPRSVPGIGFCDRDRFNGSVSQLKEHWPNL